MSLEDGKITEKTFTILTNTQQIKELTNIFKIEGQTVDDHLQFYALLLEFLGFNFLKPDHNLCSVLCMFNLVFILHFIVSGMVFMANNTGDIGKVTECFTTFLFALAIVIKLFILRRYRHNITDLISTMRYDYAKAVKADGPEKDIMMARLLEARALTRIFYYCAVACIFLFSLIPLINYKNHHLPLPAKSFLYSDVDTTTTYVLNFLYHFYAMVYSVQFFVGYESFCVYSLLVMCAKLEILEYRIQQIGHCDDFYKYSEILTEDNKNLILMDEKFTGAYVKKCIRIHQSIYRFAEEWNDVYHIDCFVELMFSGMIGCVSLYQVTEKPAKDAIPFFAYLFLCIIQIFVFCWYGNIIYQKSLNISEALYSTQWYRISPSLRKTFHIMLMRSQKPINVSAVFTNLTLEVFTDVMRSMYSFYALLAKTE